ncbi:MAG: heme-binding protein [Deltaproteobacteria bacterium]|nr:heme-binding protein [Deltaproteobacteria bacterium]
MLFMLTSAVMSASPLGAQYAEHKTLTLDGAKRAIAAAVAEAKRSGGTGVIAVVDDGGNLMAVERLDDTFAAGANISIGKARTAALFKKPSKAFEDIIGKGRTAMVALADFTPLQGGVPIVVDGQIIGAIGVSGAASAQRDEEVAIAGAHAVETSPVGASAPRVEYFPSERVRDSFAKGAVLFDGGGTNYPVHTSRRESAGQAEVHLRDTDVIYMLDGATTFVTGGSVVGGKTIAPDEIRGAAIDGGDTRRLAKGDVMIVPNGTPHWFKDVDGPVLYYVVKVR